MIAGGSKTQHLSSSLARLCIVVVDALTSGRTDSEQVAKVAAKITHKYHFSPTWELKLRSHIMIGDGQQMEEAEVRSTEEQVSRGYRRSGKEVRLDETDCLEHSCILLVHLQSTWLICNIKLRIKDTF